MKILNNPHPLASRGVVLPMQMGYGSRLNTAKKIRKPTKEFVLDSVVVSKTSLEARNEYDSKNDRHLKHFF